MKNCAITYSLFLSISLFFACSRQTGDVEKIFNEVETILEQQPDSALNLLYSIVSPNNLNESRLNKYNLLLVQAKDKTYKDISRDTLIFQVKDYYERKNDIENLTLASLYCGRVYQEQKDYKKAMEAYLKAETLSKEMANHNLKGLIESYMGYTYYESRSYNEAIDRFNKALEYFSHLQGNYKREIHTTNIIGSCYLIKHESDSAFKFYNKALHLAETHKDTIEQVRVRQNIGVAYRNDGNLSLAKDYLQSALVLVPDYDLDLLATVQLNLARTYKAQNQKDSADYYINFALHYFKENNNITALSNAYNLLSKMEESNGNLTKSLEYCRKYAEYLIDIFNENGKHNLMEIDRKYKFSLLQNEKNRLLIERQWIIMSTLGLFILIGFILFYLYRRNMKNKEILQMKEILILEANENIRKLEVLVGKKQEEQKNQQQTEKTLRNLIFENLGIFKRACTMEQISGLINNKKLSVKDVSCKIKDILFGDSHHDWEKLYKQINESFNNRFQEIKEQYPSLTETEFKILCLSCADFNNPNISLILGLADNTVKQTKSNLRQKLKIKRHENIKDVLNIS
jgi:tetratricopeptide (TPR) repeat protein